MSRDVCIVPVLLMCFGYRITAHVGSAWEKLLVTGDGLCSGRAMHPWNGPPPLGAAAECAQIYQGRESALAQ